MSKARVLVVDDSMTMRALVAGLLEKDKDIEVIGMAGDAAEARRMCIDLKPSVMTLDIEMPGMSGLEYLAEIMREHPMPVVMFSAQTAKGAASSIEALRLGALDCYPKPTRSTPDEVQKTIGRLTRTVKQAPDRFRALHDGADRRPDRDAAKSAAPARRFAWNGKLVAIGGDAASTKALFDVLGAWPADGPPAIVIQHMRPDLVDGMIAKLSEAIAPRVVEAVEGLVPEPGTVIFARPGAHHVYLDRWPGGAIRMLDQPPLAGHRPSISLMLATLAKTSAEHVVGVTLADGEDGGEGAAALRSARGYAIAPVEGGAGALEIGRGMAVQAIRPGDVAATVLKLCHD